MSAAKTKTCTRNDEAAPGSLAHSLTDLIHNYLKSEPRTPDQYGIPRWVADSSPGINGRYSTVSADSIFGGNGRGYSSGAYTVDALRPGGVTRDELQYLLEKFSDRIIQSITERVMQQVADEVERAIAALRDAQGA